MSTKDIYQTKDLTITIPAAIAALPDLNLLERAALAHISRYSACSNASLSKLTGLSVRGTEAMLARLRKRGLVEMSGEGRARRHELMFQVKPRTDCGKTEVAESHKKCGNHASGESLISCAVGTPASPFPKLDEVLKNYFSRGLFEDAHKHAELLRAQVELDTTMPCELKAKSIKALTDVENRCFALEKLQSVVASTDNLSDAQLDAAIMRVLKADPAKLALFRQRVEAGALADNGTNLFAAIDG